MNFVIFNDYKSTELISVAAINPKTCIMTIRLFFLVEGGSSKLQRAMSCDSVCSDTSVVLDTLESPLLKGELEISIEYSR